ncbi:MAG TPA: L-aspartate oxidase [Clostridiales bacterium UBA8960]|jgi:L-aspartate oxidase|nr:L-aspartate oxidase [Clostridiales bacterium UBA8960]
MEQFRDYDVVIIGAGLAGVFCALNLDTELSVALISNGSIKDTNSYLAQGGVAAPVGVGDSIDSHIEDTMRCGHGCNNREAVTQLIQDANDAIQRLMSFGVAFDTLDDGSFMLGREGAHSCARILRIGDYTGRAIMETLWTRVLERKNIDVMTNTQVERIEVKSALEKRIWATGKQSFTVQAESVVIATGGLGRLYGNTSNNALIKGDGIALAIKAGIKTQHLDWIQFHPTIYHNLKGNQEGFLISEAVRGEGAILRNQDLNRFMVDVHEMAELAPRDVVSKAIINEIKLQRNDYVWLDVRHIGNQKMAMHFPTIYEYCKKQGLELERDMIPVSPGAHYLMGGISTDLCGETNIKNIYAVGECAYTGVHGKNRLASNSLLEAMVFAIEAAKRISFIQRDKPLLSEDAFMENSTKWMDLYMGIDRNKEAIREKLMQLEASGFESNEVVLLREMLKHALEE